MTDEPAEIIYETKAPCAVHNQHLPRSHVNHHHHVWPLGEGGPTVADNLVTVCPTGHSNIHELLDVYREHSGNPPWRLVKQFSQQEREVAKLGWERMQRGSL